MRHHARAGLAWVGLALLLLGNAGLHLYAADRFAERRLYGDELLYVDLAEKHRDEGWETLLPANLEFSKRPPLWGHVLSRVAPARAELEACARRQRSPDGCPAARDRKSVLRHRYLARGRLLNLAMFSLTLALLYGQALLLGVPAPMAFLAPALLAALPRVAFHAHALWSETLHMMLQTLAFTFLLLLLRGRSKAVGTYACALGAGAAMGCAILTRSTLTFFAPCSILLVGVQLYSDRRRRKLPRVLRFRRAFLAMAFVTLGIALAVGPKLWTEHTRGNGLRVAANTWINVRRGMRPVLSNTRRQRWLRADSKAYRTWFDEAGRAAASAPRARHPHRYVRREQGARAHILQFLTIADPWALLTRQTTRTWAMLTQAPSHFERSLGKRLSPRGTRRALAPMVAFDRHAFHWLLLLGLSTMPWMVRTRDGGWILLGTFTAYYLVALIAVPINPRMALHMLPALCLSLAATSAELTAGVAGAVRRLRPRPL
ncbi:MAG: hypothetical protein OXU20_12850 [Myxococcales bacterium]|nr:hypothetical protein [Myxococcales bacterium]